MSVRGADVSFVHCYKKQQNVRSSKDSGAFNFWIANTWMWGLLAEEDPTSCLIFWDLAAVRPLVSMVNIILFT